MCLITKQKEPLKAKKKILVYKVLDQHDFPPYYPDYPYKHGKNKAMGPKQVVKEKDGDENWVYWVYGGFLHAYTSEERAYANALAYNITDVVSLPHTDYDRLYQVNKMYVPVGAEYYIDEQCGEICADCLVWK